MNGRFIALAGLDIDLPERGPLQPLLREQSLGGMDQRQTRLRRLSASRLLYAHRSTHVGAP
jgi:hypothetical protein